MIVHPKWDAHMRWQNGVQGLQLWHILSERGKAGRLVYGLIK
jgi:hypothetical protein